jgi:hypothetical protein
MSMSWVDALDWAVCLFYWGAFASALIRVLRKPRGPALNAEDLLFRLALVVLVGVPIAYHYWGGRIDASQWGRLFIDGFLLSGAAWLTWSLIADRRRR